MKYWLQVKAPAGNWVDWVGTDDLESAKDHAAWLVEEGHYRETRVVERLDTVIWECSPPVPTPRRAKK